MTHASYRLKQFLQQPRRSFEVEKYFMELDTKNEESQQTVVGYFQPVFTVDRKRIAPFLVRVFVSIGDFNRESDFLNRLPSNEENVYCWKDTTLRELVCLLGATKDVFDEPTAKFEFRAIAADVLRQDGRFRCVKVGSVCNSRRDKTDDVCLASTAFMIGDFLDICVLDLPRRDKQRRVDRWR